MIYYFKTMKHFLSIFCVLSMFLTTSIAVAGQDSYLFHHLSTGNGLSNSSVKAILRDSEGFLWIGTESGLNRYDGYGFKVYTRSTTDILWTDDIWSLQEDGLGNIWIGSSNRYIVYRHNQDRFLLESQTILQNLGIKVEKDFRVYIDRNKDIWVLTKETAYFYNIQQEVLKTFDMNPVHQEIFEMELTDDGEELYIAYRPCHLWKLNKKVGKPVAVELSAEIYNTIANNHCRVYVDYRKGLWLSSFENDWVYYRRTPKEEWQRIILQSEGETEGNAVRAILDDQYGHIWIATDHKGIFIYDGSATKLTNLVSNPWTHTSIASNNVATIYRDDIGTIWLGHYKKGISYYHESFYQAINPRHSECGDIGAILEDHAGNIWLGTDGNGLYMEEKKTGKIIKLPIPNITVTSLLEDQKGRIWIGTYLNGLYCYENGRMSQYTNRNSELPNNSAWALKEDRYGHIWIGSAIAPLVCFYPDEKKFVPCHSSANEQIYALSFYYDDDDKLYVGTFYGVYVIDIVNGKHEVILGNRRGTQQFKQLLVSNMYKDEQDILWLGHLQGLTAWDLKTDTLYYIDKENGLCDNIVQGIIGDNHRNTLVTTSNGFSVVSVERDLQGKIAYSIRNFSTKDGLKDNFFNVHAVCKQRNGDILLGGTEGYTFINPNKMAEKNQPSAHVTFTGLSIGNQQVYVDSLYDGRKLLQQSIESTKSLILRYNDNLITLEFTTGDLLNADKVKYAYQLQGFNQQWFYTAENKITFTTLPPGNYLLQIKACNSDGVWSDEITTLAMSVAPPFYLSVWAYVLYSLLVFGGTAFIIYRTRRHHQVRLEQQRTQLEHEQRIRLNEMKLMFFTNISHDLRTPLTLILSPLQLLMQEQMSDSMRKKLDIMHKNAQQLLTLINSLLDFRKLDAGAETLRCQSGDMVGYIRELCIPFQEYAVERDINFTFTTEEETVFLAFDFGKVKKIVSNLLSNAFKYTPDGKQIEVHVYREEEHVCVSIADTGQGISDEDKKHIFERFYQTSNQQEKTGSGIGLHIVSEYVRLHKGVISVSDNYPEGAVFTFKLPMESSEMVKTSAEEMDEDKLVIEEQEHAISEHRQVILFVDDNKDLCDFMTDNFSDDYSVLTAYNGQEALDLLNSKDIDIVVSDIMMPIMNGTELCRRIKNDIRWSHIPVILLTARTAEESRIEGLEQGADDYITKPFNFNLLKLRIDKFIEWTKKCHRAFSQKIDVAPSEITITSLDEQLIEKAVKVVEEHLSDTDFSVEILGEAVGLSRSHLYKKLMCITGKGPAEFIRTVRLKRGKQLLEKSQMQIAEIAYAVGFNSPKRFTLNFKSEFGMSPSDYLRSLK